MIKIRHAFMPLALLAAATLSACGGGGGGGDGGAPGNTSSAKGEALAITADNYEQVALNAGASAVNTSQSGGAVDLVGVQSQSVHWLADVVAAVKQNAATWGGADTLVGVDSTTNCGSSGTHRIVFSDTNKNNAPDVGETIQIDYFACVDNDGVQHDGSLFGKITQVGADQGITGFEATMTGLKFTQNGMSVTLDGRLAQVQLPGLLTVSAPDLRMVASAQGKTETDSWQNFLYNEDTSESGVRKQSFAGLLTSSGFGNKTVEVSTPVALTFVGEATVPAAGTLKVKGANNSVATVTVNGEVAPVKITLDANGDGTIEKSKDVLWSDIVDADLS